MNKLYKKGRLEPKPIYLDEKELSKNLGSGNFIFVGSSCDMWAEGIIGVWIDKVLQHIKKYPDNKYLFQSKNPARFIEFFDYLPEVCHVGTTIETNRYYPCMGLTPHPDWRAAAIAAPYTKTRFVTIEPILDFDMRDFLAILKNANPDYINIGADSGNNRLPEPEPEKTRELIKELEKFTKVHLKKNLKRLLPEE
jgi:protein gp37